MPDIVPDIFQDSARAYTASQNLSRPHRRSYRNDQEIVEVRDYTIDPEWLEPYRQWATEVAVPWLRAHLDLVDFWMDGVSMPKCQAPILHLQLTASQRMLDHSLAEQGRPR